MARMLSQNEAIELLKSGNYTIAYHDNGSPSLYNGKHEYDSLPKKEVYIFEENFNGYIPEVVFCLSEALKGAVETI